MQGRRDPRGPLDQAGWPPGRRAAGLGVVEQRVEQAWQVSGEVGRAGVGGGAPHGGDQVRPAVAEGGVCDAGELGGVGQARGQGVFCLLLAGMVAGGLPGELLGAGEFPIRSAC